MNELGHKYEVVARSYGVAIYSPTGYRMGGFTSVADAKKAVLEKDREATFFGDVDEK